MSVTKGKVQVDKMDVNTYYLELMFILLNVFQPQKLMKKTMLAEILFLSRNDKKHQKKNLIVNLLELIHVSVVMKNRNIGRIETFISRFKDRQLKKL